MTVAGARSTSIAVLLMALASVALAQKSEIIETPDPALGVTLFAPRKPPTHGVNQWLAKMDRINWNVYPIIYQKLDRTGKVAMLKVNIVGSVGFTNASLTVNLDGDVKTIPSVSWTWQQGIFYNTVSAMVGLRDESFRKFAAAKDVYVTVLLPGSVPDRYTVHLTGNDLGVFRTMLGKYDELEPTTASADRSPAAPSQ